MTDLTDRDTIRILLVDDEKATADSLKRTLEETLSDAEVHVEDGPGCFDRALAALESPRPFEAVVLDLYEGIPQEGRQEGNKVWEQIWERRLVPVIFYTGGECDLDPPIPENNPFLRCFHKGYGKDEEVALYVQSIEPYILALRQVEEELGKAIGIVIKDVSPLIWQATETDTGLRSELLVRSARRRLAAAMDLNTAVTNDKLQHWEQYIYPPLGSSLLTGDVLFKLGDEQDDPSAYRLVLTPSCDMQVRPNGECNVSSVLVTKCKPINEYIQMVTSTFKPKPKALPDLITRVLTEPHQSGYVPLPEYKTLVPCMAADLRDLELIRVSDIGMEVDSTGIFTRVVSVDSPFREQIAWAYLQVSGRPGLPDRDLEKWSAEIIQTSESNSRRVQQAAAPPESSAATTANTSLAEAEGQDSTN